MNPAVQWTVWSVLGAANALLVGLGGVIVVLVLLPLAARAALRGDRLAGLSGLLAGFGIVWIALLARQSATGGHLDEDQSLHLIGDHSARARACQSDLRARWHGSPPSLSVLSPADTWTIYRAAPAGTRAPMPLR